MENLKAMLVNVHKSLTLWFNAVTLALMEGLPAAQEQLPQLQQYVSPQFYQHAMVVLIVGNILLRFKTTKGLADK